MSDREARADLLVLQGPVGGFFAHLTHSLEASGLCVLNVAFNLGDLLVRRAGRTEFFRGGLEAWRARFETLCAENRPQAILLFGDRRPVHIVACEVAAKLGLRVFAFEEGYLRPDYVTLEEGGNNARSPLPRKPGAFGEPEPAPAIRRVGDTLARMGWAATRYYVALALGRALHPRYRHHRRRNVVSEGVRWHLCWMRKYAASRRDERLSDRLITHHSNQFYIVGLQVHDDLQMIHHARSWTQERLIEETIASFARSAPDDAQLVLRHHPMDCGHRSYGALVKAVAQRRGVGGRVHLMLGGHAPTLLNHAAGFITINSTMALQAMFHHCPVFAFGDTFYRVPGLIASGREAPDLDRFWRDPTPVDQDLFQRFRAHVRDASQINGSYYQPQHFAPMALAVVERLAEAGVRAANVARFPTRPAARWEAPTMTPAATMARRARIG